MKIPTGFDATRLVIFAALVIGGWFAVRQALEWRDQANAAKAVIAQHDQTAKATTGIGHDIAKATAGRDQATARLVDETRRLNAEVERLRHVDKAVDDFLVMPVPPSLRQLARQRREQRDRPGPAAAGSSPAHPGTPAAR
jgi:hypothetical protein